ncbi:MAG: SRPBCC family protein [Blastococcus sp.]
MARIQGEVLIRRPVEEVFDFVADERNEPTYNPNMLGAEKVSAGPIGVGTRFRATIRSGRRPLGMQIEYTAFDRPHLLASTSRMAAADFSGTLTFTPAGGATRLRWDWQARPKGAVRFLAPVFAPIGARQERRMWMSLRDNLEAGDHADSVLDRHLPEFDVRERHSRVLLADVAAVHAAIGQTDLTGIPVVRALLVLRALPGRLRARLDGRATPVPPPFTLADMPRAGWTPLAEGPEEVAFGTLTQPWRIGNEAPLVVDRESFAAFSTPGYAKVAFSIRADPDGPHRTRVTTETRVATTDPRSRKRFAAYWVVIGPVSALIRRLILRRLAMQVEP